MFIFVIEINTKAMNNLSTSLFMYGQNHGYWSSYDEFRRRSKHDREMISDIMTEEIIGVSPFVDIEIKISELEEFSEAKRKEYEDL